MENGWTEHIEALMSATAAMRDNIAQKQMLIDKLVDENARLRESFDKKTGGGKMMLIIGCGDDAVISIHDCNRAEVDEKIPGLSWPPGIRATYASIEIGAVRINFFEGVKHDEKGT